MAQIAPGSWRHIDSFGEPQGIAVTAHRAYVLSGGSIFAIDADEGNLHYCSSEPGLSGSVVDIVRPHPDGSCIMAAMADGSIDILRDNGAASTMRDVADAAVSGSRSINDAAFAPDGSLYVATDFGLVKYNPERRTVIDYGIYGRKVDAVAAGASTVYISVGDSLMSASAGGSIRRMEDFVFVGLWKPVREMHAVGSRLLVRRDGGIGLYDVSSSLQPLRIVDGDDASPLSPSGFDVAYTSCGGDLWKADSEGLVRICGLPEDLKSGIVALRTGETDVWGVDAKGILRMQRTSDGQWTTAMQRLRPQALAGNDLTWITPVVNSSALYFSNLGSSIYRTVSDAEGGSYGVHLNVTRLDDDGFHDVTPGGRSMRAPLRVASDPEDFMRYYATSGVDGMISVKDGLIEGYFNSDNTPIDNTWGSRILDAHVDAYGNLWIIAFVEVSRGGVLVLPAEKRRLGPDRVSRSDWVVLPMPDVNLSVESHMVHPAGSNVVFMFDEGLQQVLVAYDHGGNPLDTSGHRMLAHRSFIDQDQRVFTPQFITAMDVAPDGTVWCGTPTGMFEISSPEAALDPDMIVRRLKIGHDDGTGLADYLLDSDIVLDIARDGAGRRWIATANSGVMLVSPRGDEIIKHFTQADSPLPSDEVRAVRPSVTTNSVYMLTSSGAMEYGSDAAAPAQDLAKLHVYPNPVTPQTPGPVTIEGLIDGSLVKITDARGAVVYQTRARGGMATWNCENFSGHYVSSGVYYILASPKSGESGAASAKIMVIN